jgi:hypothetical protein
MPRALRAPLKRHRFSGAELRDLFPAERGRRHRAHAGEVLEVIGHVGKHEGVRIEETERREERPPKEERRGERTARAPANRPKGEEEPKDADREKILPPLARIDAPARVHEEQVRGPQQLAGVK